MYKALWLPTILLTLGIGSWLVQPRSGSGIELFLEPTRASTIDITVTPSITPTQLPYPPPIEPTPTMEPSPSIEPAPTNTQIPPPPAVGLTITGVEPSKISKLSGGTLSIYGTGFTQGAAVRLVGYGLLDAAVLTNTAIRAVVPPGLPSGTYDLEVILANGTSTIAGGAVRIKSPAEPSPTPTSSTEWYVYGQPQLLIQSSKTTPESLRPGGAFTLTLQITNRGDYTATKLRIALSSLDLAVPRGGSNLVVVDTLESNQTIQVDLPLALSEKATPGYNSLNIQLDFSDYVGRDFTSNQSVGLNVTNALSDQPLILLTAYSTEPESIAPGDAFTLLLEISNVGKKDAEQLLLTLGGQDGTGLKPFAIIDSGNVKFIPMIPAGEALKVEQHLVLDGTANPGVYNLPVSLSYDGPDGSRQNENQVLNLMASRRPQLQIDFYRSVPPGLAGQPIELPIEVVNIGRDLVNVSTVQISGEKMEISDGSAFLGALDGGTSGSMDATIVAQESGTLPILVTVNYLDDFNHPRVITQTLSVQVEAPQITPQVGGPGASQSGQPAGFWDRVLRFLRGLFGLGS
jgi:hypothetical protein